MCILPTCLFGIECGSVIAGLKPLVESFRLQQGNSFWANVYLQTTVYKQLSILAALKIREKSQFGEKSANE
jgi:hypothetical protein